MTFSLPVLNMGYKIDLLQLTEVLFWRLTYSLCATNKASKHDSLQVIKFVYWLSKYSLSVLNMDSKHDLLKVMKFEYCARTSVYLYWIRTLNMTYRKYKIIALGLDMHPIGPPYGFQTWVAPTENFHVFALELQSICAVYELETWLPLRDEIRV